MGLSNELNCKIDIYGKKPGKNRLDEIIFTYGKIKTVWAKIVPGSGSLRKAEGNASYAEISHTITIRANAVKELTNDMYFIFKGQRYDVRHFNPNYKHRDRVEIMCSLVVEK